MARTKALPLPAEDDPRVLRIPAPGEYLTDGTRLVLVLEDARKGYLVEDTKTGDHRYFLTCELASWAKVGDADYG